MIREKNKRTVKRIVAFFMVLLLSINTPVMAQENNQKCNQKKDYIVVTRNENSGEKVKKQKVANQLNTKKTVLQVALTADEVSELERNKDIVSIESNIKIEGCGEKSKQLDEYDSEWNIRMINANRKHKDIPKNKVKIAIIDSGVNYNENVNVKVRKNYVLEEEGISMLYEDLVGHGTAIAGIIAGKNEKGYKNGINDNVELYSIKVLDENNMSTLDRIIKAIYKAIDYKVNIINMSFGTTVYSQALKDAIEEANKAGILLVASAGNRGNSDNQVEYPAAFGNVLSVGAVDYKGNISDTSSTGQKVDIYAPGEKINSTAIFNGKMVCSGTSMSAPHVVGVASVLWQKNLKKSSEFIRELLIASANKESNEKGIVDLNYALEIYNDFEKDYNSEKTDKEYANHNELNVSKDMRYVEGAWSKNNHEAAVNNSKGVKDYNGKTYTNKALKLIIRGIRMPDKDTNNMAYNKGSSNEHPWWHAGTVGTVNGTYVVDYLGVVNFVNILIKTTQCDINKVGKPNGLGGYIYSEMKNNLSNSITNSEIEAAGYNVTATSKRYVYWGVIMHTLTDAYAHRAYVKNYNGEYKYITDNTVGMATDNINDISERYNSACQVVQNIMKQCINVEEPYSSKYVSAKQLALSSSYYNGKFKLQNLSEYIQEASFVGDATNSQINILNNLSISTGFKSCILF